MAKKSDLAQSIQEDFFMILLVDAIASIERYRAANPDEQIERRQLLRTLFSALEGFTWVYREHIRESASLIGALSAEETIALAEKSYQVTEQGKLASQPRYISMVATIRLISRIASRLSPELQLSFETADWSEFRKVVEVRNRLTHPKRKSDLNITDSDVKQCLAAFFWLLENTMQAMEATNVALKSFVQEFREILKSLQEGDPDTLEAYRRALAFVSN